jgi:opacity protein-like surface antigen
MAARKALIIGLLLAAAVPALIASALAQPENDGITSGVYAGIRGSYAFSGNRVTTWAPTTPMTQLRGSLAAGGGGSVVVGTHLPLNLRGEIEGMYRYQSLSKVSLDGVQVAAGGRSQSAGAMLNILWDIPMPLESPVLPFVGMGIGVIHTDLNFAGGGNTYMHQSRWDPAYSMMAGFALPLDDVSRLTAMYRWTQTIHAPHSCAVSGSLQRNCLNNPVDSSSVDLGYEMEL